MSLTPSRQSLIELEAAAPFTTRHIGPTPGDRAKMVALLGRADLDDLVDEAVPPSIRSTGPLALAAGRSEADVLTELRALAARNTPMTSMIGMGYSGTFTPPVVLRKVLENPGWYTAYTPYQPEISQGRLEALLNFQTMVADLTGLPTAGASLLDEGTAAAEAMMLLRRATSTGSHVFLVDADTHPQTVAVLATRAEPLGVVLRLHDVTAALPDEPWSRSPPTCWP